jgi:hypothetical protein
MGLLRLEQRAAVGRVPDMLDRNLRLVAFTPMEDRAVLEMRAIRELEDAIYRAVAIRLDERLLATDMNMEEAFIVPCVGDLLTAIGADNFAGKAHNLLFGLHLDRGELLAAELHLDAAVATGVAALYGYQDLAEAYVNLDQPQVLARLMRKDLEANEPLLVAACNRLMQWQRETFADPWLW